jgi:hypothetical protein
LAARQIGDNGEQPLAVAECGDPKLLEILGGQTAQDLFADFVLCESLGVLS